MPLLRKPSRGPHHLAVSMVGVKLGDRLLQVGCGDGGLLAALAAKVGLTGRACGIDATAAGAEKGRIAGARAGVLVEIAEAPYGALPGDAGAFDVAVVYDVLAPIPAADRAACLREVNRVLRPGGRCVVVERTPRGFAAWFGRLAADPDYAASGGAEAALRTAGFLAVRTLSERDGYRFVEGVKPRTA